MRLENTLINGDSLEYIKTIPDNSIDFIFTDPPYLYKDLKVNTTNINNKSPFSRGTKAVNKLNTLDILNSYNIKDYFKEYFRITKNNVSWCIFMNKDLILDHLLEYREITNNDKNYNFEIITIHKKNHSPFGGLWFTDKEFLIHFYKTGVKGGITNNKFSGSRKTIFSINNHEIAGSQHPTKKWPSVCNFIIEKLTNKDDIVLDPFMGEGTIPECANNLNRGYIGIEISKKYYDLSVKACKVKQERLF